MSFACTHLDVAIQAACCEPVGNIFTDVNGSSFCGTTNHVDFISCAGVDSKCSYVVDVEKRQGEYYLLNALV